MNRRGFLGALFALPLMRIFKRHAPERVVGMDLAAGPDKTGIIYIGTPWHAGGLIADMLHHDNALLVHLRRGHVTPAGQMLSARARAFRKVIANRERASGYAQWRAAA